MPIRIVSTASEDVFRILASRGIEQDHALEKVVAEIIADVRARGDEALLDSARKFDSPSIDSLMVTAEELDAAKIEPHHRDALAIAHDRVHHFHEEQMRRLFGGMERPSSAGWSRVGQEIRYVRVTDETSPSWSLTDRGSTIGQRYVPVNGAGVYVPGGRAAYPSSVIMNAVPAWTAGVNEVVVTTPARPDGTLDPAVLVAMQLTGVSAVAKVGGSAAIAALAFGTESVPRVDKIVGPGNRFVNEAKRQVWGQVGVDGYAGPSEVCVLVDEFADPNFAAADLLTQIEHAPDNVAFVVALSEAILQQVLEAIELQLTVAPRAETMRQALKGSSLAIVVRDLKEACDVVNAIAPEHLSLAVRDSDRAFGWIRNAGAILVGEWTPESGGDYAIGPSHTLPTAGAARWQSPVNVLEFLRVQSVMSLSRATFQELAPVIQTLGDLEGFPQHAAGATVRLQSGSSKV